MTPKQLDRANVALDRIKDAVRRIVATWPNSQARRRAELDHEQACAAMRAVLGEVEASERGSHGEVNTGRAQLAALGGE